MTGDQRSEFDPVLVTGAAGFIGCCSVRRLLDLGYTVHVPLREPDQAWRLRDVLGRLHIHNTDLREGRAVREVFARAAPRAVVHLSAYGAYEWQKDGQRILETVVLGTHHLLEASGASGVRIFVNAGSSSEYGYRDAPMQETDLLQPNSVYAVAKAAQTHLASLAAGPNGVPAVTLRLFSVYGPWEEPSRLLPTVLRRAMNGQPLQMAHPDTARDFVYVEDVLDVLLGFERLSSFRGEVFNIGTGLQSTLRDVVDAVLAVTGRRSEVQWGAIPPRRWDTNRWQADTGKSRKLLGWAPRHTLAAGVERMAAWMAAAGSTHG